MIAFLRDRMDAWLGRGQHSTSVPVMDGPLQPNQRIETAPVLLRAEGLDNLTAGDGLFYSAGPMLMRHEGEELARFDASVSALAAHGQALAVGVEGKGVTLRGGPHDARRIERLGGQPAACPTALLFDGPDRLIVALGASDRLPAQWKHDLMSHGRSGSVWAVDLRSGAEEKLADGLAWPCGVVKAGDGFVVSEAWRHRLVRPGDKPLIDRLPGYPGRLIPHGEGYLLAIFAPRNQLVEFVLRERDYREDMVREIHPDHWIAPSLQAAVSFLEPLQGGAVRQMGELKPWAPTRSYGLVVRLDRNFLPVESWHSRADGRRHGITSLAVWEGRVIAGSHGTGEALILEEAA
ncbi:MAG: strictosidine synthase [Paracoccus sp. BP8]|uniref:hypothetical protein n=1 Tax=Paracoccus sp. J39 TaxID=935848 RepID=UPI00048E72C0|nr:hypothetical protein [Paracoccus sp. J39]RQP08154.1 MAG: strictosidine synthase [Paracoccus sp. BP8]